MAPDARNALGPCHSTCNCKKRPPGGEDALPGGRLESARVLAAPGFPT